jgi:hypothetical protein
MKSVNMSVTMKQCGVFSSSVLVVGCLWLLGRSRLAVMFHVNGIVFLLGCLGMSIVWVSGFLGLGGWAIAGFNVLSIFMGVSKLALWSIV